MLKFTTATSNVSCLLEENFKYNDFFFLNLIYFIFSYSRSTIQKLRNQLLKLEKEQIANSEDQIMEDEELKLGENEAPSNEVINNTSFKKILLLLLLLI
jgi:hypothetical protein